MLPDSSVNPPVGLESSKKMTLKGKGREIKLPPFVSLENMIK